MTIPYAVTVGRAVTVTSTDKSLTVTGDNSRDSCDTCDCRFDCDCDNVRDQYTCDSCDCDSCDYNLRDPHIHVTSCDCDTGDQRDHTCDVTSCDCGDHNHNPAEVTAVTGRDWDYPVTTHVTVSRDVTESGRGRDGDVTGTSRVTARRKVGGRTRGRRLTHLRFSHVKKALYNQVTNGRKSIHQKISAMSKKELMLR